MTRFALLLILAVTLSACDLVIGPEKDYPFEVLAGEQARAPEDAPFLSVNDALVGAVGCSMTRDILDPGLSKYTAVDGWLKVAPNGQKVLKQYSGGTIGRWGFPGANGYNNKWSAFNSGLSSWPGTNIILWQICIRADEVTGSVNDYAGALQHIAGRIAQEAPGVPVYVTGMPTYEPGHLCSITGPDGVQFSRDLAELAASITGANFATGLDLDLESPSYLGGDGCHASQAGAQHEAQLLVAWLESL